MLSWFKKRTKSPRQELGEVLGTYQLPSFPRVVFDALTLIRDPDIGLDRVSAKVSGDPGISARLLRLSNSSAFALRREVRSVHHAVSLLGRTETESLLLSIAVKTTLPTKKRPGFDPAAFWHAAARRATAARALAGVLQPSARSESFTAALLGDMAVPLILEARGAAYRSVLDQWRADGGDLADLEAQAFGWNHAHVAGWLCEEWKFPAALTDAIGGHHEGSAEGLAPVSLVAHLGENSESGLAALVDAAHTRYGLRPDEVRRLVTGSFEEAESVANHFAC